MSRFQRSWSPERSFATVRTTTAHSCPRSLARNTLNLVNRAFQLRTCEIEIDGKLPRPCLEYHLKRCLGPCVKGLCTQDEYQEAAADVKMLLEGKNKELAKTLEQRMWQFSEEGKYELAAKYRDLHNTVLALSETQKMATTAERDIDIIGFYREKQRLALQLFTMREGRIVGRREFFWEDLPEDDSFDASAFLGRGLVAILFDRLRPARNSCPAGFRGSRGFGKSLDRTSRPPGQDPGPKTRKEQATS